MKLSENDVSFMRSVEALTADGRREATIKKASSDQRQAFKKLKEQGLVAGHTFLDGHLDASLTADGRQALRETEFWPRCKTYLAARFTAFFDHLLSHVLALAVGLLTGWLLAGGGQTDAPNDAPAEQSGQEG